MQSWMPKSVNNVQIPLLLYKFNDTPLVYNFSYNFSKESSVDVYASLSLSTLFIPMIYIDVKHKGQSIKVKDAAVDSSCDLLCLMQRPAAVLIEVCVLVVRWMGVRYGASHC